MCGTVERRRVANTPIQPKNIFVKNPPREDIYSDQS